MNRIVAGDGIFGNENMKTAFQAFQCRGADTGVQMHSGENDRVVIYFFERGIQFATGKSVEADFMDDGFIFERL